MNNATIVNEVSGSASIWGIEAKLSEFNELGKSLGLQGMTFSHDKEGEVDNFISKLSRMSGYFEGQLLDKNLAPENKKYILNLLFKKENEVSLYIYAKFGDKDAIAMIAALNNKLTKVL